jgi:hypothetical protein
MIGKVIAFFVGLVGAVAAWFALVKRKDLEVEQRIEEAREVAEMRNAERSEAIEERVAEIKAEVESVDDRDELARMLDE